MKKITVSILSVLMMLSMVFSSSVFAANEQPSAWESFVGLFTGNATTTATDAVGVEYRGHIQNVGNYPTNPAQWVQGPTQLGTVGQSLRLEGFWIQLTNKPANVNIQYRVHVQNVGWMAPVENGNFAGTEGQSQRIEAIEINLVDDAGNAVQGYSVMYKGHVQNQGDTAWFEDGQQLGTTGSSLRLEALEVKIVTEKSDLTAYNAALAAVTQADYTAASWTTYKAVVDANVVTEDDPQAEVDAATAAITAAQANLVKELKVVSVSAIDLTGIEVKFSKTLDKTTAEDVTKYALALSSNGNTISLAGATAKLQEDAKTVKIHLTTPNILVNQAKHKLTVNGVRAFDKVEKIEDKVVEFTALDTIAPTVTSVASNGLRQIKVVFSEDVQNELTAGNYKLNGKALSAYGAGGISFDYTTNTATIPFSIDLPVGANELEVSVDGNITDFVPLKVVATKVAFTVTDDQSALAISKGEVLELKAGNAQGLTAGKYVKVTFNKPLSYDGLIIAGTRSTTGTSISNIFLNGAVANATIVDGALYVTKPGATPSVESGTQLVRIDQQGLTTTATSDDFYVVDTSGVKLPTNSTVSVTVEVDTTKPTVDTITVQSSTNILVKFTEDVTSASATSLANYTLRDKDNAVVTLSSPVWNYDGLGESYVRFTVADGLKNQNYTLQVKDVQDKAGNKADSVTKTFNPGDVIAPVLDGATTVEADRTVFVKFSKSINNAALTNKANYTINGKALPTGATVTAQQEDKVLKITLPSSFVTTDLVGGVITGNVLVAANIVDTNGNKMAGLYQQTTIVAVAPITVVAFKDSSDLARVIDSRTIQLNLSTQLAQLDTSSFTVTKTAGSVPVLATSTFENTTTGSLVTLRLGADATSTSTATDLAAGLTVSTVANKDTKGLDESKITAAGTVANVDKIAPVFVSAKQVNTTTNADKFDVTLSESVTWTNGLQNDLVVKDINTGKALDLADFTVAPAATGTSFRVTITKAGVVNHKISIGLNNGRFITDAASNLTATFADKVVRNQADTEDALISDKTLPTVSLVSSTLGDGSYTVGQVVPVTVKFTEAVIVTGTPTLTLATGSPATTAVNYTSGSGTDTLTFNYTVATGNTSADLDYAATTSLALNGGTILDGASNAATLTLVAPGAVGSLGNAKAIVIDTAAPTVTAVSSTLADGSYTVGQVVPVTVQFNEAVTVTGTPTLTLTTGTPATTAVNYTSGSGTNTLTFNYTVAAGNTSADLDYAATTSLALNGGTINDAATNAATLTLVAPGAVGSLGNAKAIVIDTTVPGAPVAANITITDNISPAVDTMAGAAGAVEGNATVKIYSDAGLTTQVGSDITAAANGSFAAANLTNATSGTITYYVVAVDAAGNVSAATSKAYTAAQ